MKYTTCNDEDVSKLEVKPFYDDSSVNSLNIHFNNTEIEERENNEFAILKKIFNSYDIKASRIINPGCGTGYACSLAIRLNLNYVGIDFSSQQIALANSLVNKNERIKFINDNFLNISNYLKNGDFVLIQFLLQFFLDKELDLIFKKISKNYKGYLFIEEGVSTLKNRIIIKDHDMKIGHFYNTQYRTIHDFLEIFSKYFFVLEYDFILQNIKTERIDTKYMYFVLKNF
ncbi:hypothetical protein BJP41_00885 [Candidatus Williamhamiltonella defendens]|uniref:Methyltransferase domain-containing protein n=1 Tax=Candidatus Williamhamiltonella defendens TaxID=138072 RepID=A0A2D3T5X3_9ENTR|nr:class I SAM-dependent methyltransferase [Candidatus Hamiltonella defensa]ATW29134.1 hypothetical protein BJP41_00885 [Candidatus Hamiltonella defensa]ATW31114.1 hypothetical protein BJP42_00975 [Candidatus Hamiltonella defensa]